MPPERVTLGGTGKESGDRHPKILHGTLIGAGAQILGNITVGPGARVVGGSGSDDPGKAMDQVLPDSCYASFTYVI